MTAGWDKAVRLWDVSTGQGAASPLLVQSLISGAAAAVRRQGCAGRLSGWHGADLEPDHRQAHQPNPEPQRRRQDVSFVPNQKAVATGSYDGTVRIWDHPDPVSGSTEEFGPGSKCSHEWNCCRMGPFAFSIPEEWARRGRMLEALGGAPASLRRASDVLQVLTVHHLEQA